MFGGVDLVEESIFKMATISIVTTFFVLPGIDSSIWSQYIGCKILYVTLHSFNNFHVNPPFNRIHSIIYIDITTFTMQLSK